MQQVRLVAAAPPLASASVSLNTSVLYIGQAIGSAIGGVLFAPRTCFARRSAIVAVGVRRYWRWSLVLLSQAARAGNCRSA